MLVMFTGRPPPSSERLDGVVYGVKALLACVGYGTISRNAPGPAGPPMPCDSSMNGRLPTTRQIKRPSPGRSAAKPFLRRVFTQEDTPPRGPRATIREYLAASSAGDRTNFCFTVGSITAGLIQPSCSLHQALNCCGRPLGSCSDIVHHLPRPSEPGFSGRAYRSGRPSMWPNSWHGVLMLAMRS